MQKSTSPFLTILLKQHSSLQSTMSKKTVAAAIGVKDYVTALTEIATLRGPVDTFFDKVMVMADDEKVRQNRLALLTLIARLFGHDPLLLRRRTATSYWIRRGPPRDPGSYFRQF